MIRTLVGYATVGVIGFVVVKILFSIVGLVLSLLWTLLWVAAIGFLLYLVLKLINPKAALKSDSTSSRCSLPSRSSQPSSCCMRAATSASDNRLSSLTAAPPDNQFTR